MQPAATIEIPYGEDLPVTDRRTDRGKRRRHVHRLAKQPLWTYRAHRHLTSVGDRVDGSAGG